MTFLFDIGRVLLDFDFKSSLSRLLPPNVTDVTKRLERLLERKDDFEAGRIEVDAYTNWALDVLETNATAEEFHHAWRSIFTPNEPMWQRVRQLSADGHRLILFSNINGIHVPWIYDEYQIFALFDEAVFSFEAGSIKPDPEIYQHAIDAHRLVPQETFYIDDLPQNIVTGKQFGFHSWQYDLNDHSSFDRWLASFNL